MRRFLAAVLFSLTTLVGSLAPAHAGCTYAICQALTTTGTPTTAMTSSFATNVMTVTAITGSLVNAPNSTAVGTFIYGTSVPANTYITAQLTGSTGSIGTYSLSTTPGTIAGEAITTQFGWQVIAGWSNSNNKVEVIGGGAPGLNAGFSAGQAGAYNFVTNITLTPSSWVPYTVGASVAGSTSTGTVVGNPTMFNSNTVTPGSGTTNVTVSGGYFGGGTSASGWPFTNILAGGISGSDASNSGPGAGGAAGPGGAGKNGGNNSTTAGAGGGAGGGGTVGGNASGSTPGNGGTASGGGSGVGGNGGAVGADGSPGGNGTDMGGGSWGAGGGGGGGANSHNGGVGGNYGGGGGSAGTSGTHGGASGPGVIVISSGVPSSGNPLTLVGSGQLVPSNDNGMPANDNIPMKLPLRAQP